MYPLALKAVRVAGHSMAPELNDKDYVLIVRGPRSRYLVGQVVMVRHPELGTIIKRILEVKGRRYRLAGDNPASMPSYKMGWIHHSQIAGRVLTRIKRSQVH
ncbi:MAG: S24/S26 family peptidase [Pseudomonadota bacterium]